MALNKEEILKTLKMEMAPALGVTEPSTIALATAKAYKEIKGNVGKIELTLDPGIYKNAYSCGIPNTNEKGIEIAALLGALNGDSNLGLQVLKNINQNDVKKAKKLKENNLVEIDIKDGYKDIYVKSKVITDNGYALAVIKSRHDNINYIEVNNKIIYEKADFNNQESNKDSIFNNFRLDEVINFINSLNLEEIKFALDAVKMNKNLSASGEQGTGLELGKGLNELNNQNEINDDIINKAKILTAFAVDARMGGVPKPAMSFCGSGDHGIIATLPIAALAEKKKVSKENLARSIILSYLITYYIKHKTGKLSAYCGCAIAAGMGAAAGSTYLLDGDLQQINGAVNNIAGNITGMICDGGNFGCSLKAVTAAGLAVESALLAINDYYLKNNNGVVGNSLKDTLDNVSKIATPGMEQTNEVIINILKKRSQNEKWDDLR